MSAMPTTPRPSPTSEQEALLRARYDGQVKTLRELGEETDVHWTTWRRWALELRLKNPADQQPQRGYRSAEKRYTSRKPAAIAVVPDEPEAIEESEESEVPDEAPEFDENAAAYAMETEEEEAVQEPAPTPTPTPTPTPLPTRRPEPRGSGRLPYTDQRFLQQFMERLPYSWTHEERGRWLRAFIAALDLVVVEWPPAEEMEGRP